MQKVNTLQKIFQGHELTIFDDGEPKFLLRDVCKILGLGQVSGVTRRLGKDVIWNHPLETAGGTQLAIFVNEDGLYDVILDSRKPEAKNFRKWITRDVLPSIRKTGAYVQPKTQSEVIAMIAQDNVKRDKTIKAVVKDVDYLKENMRISGAQEKQIWSNANRKVIKCLGGKDSAAYKSISRKVFPQFWREFKSYFQIPRYGELPKAQFDEALNFIDEWAPSTSLRFDIKAMNNQQHLKLVE